MVFASDDRSITQPICKVPQDKNHRKLKMGFRSGVTQFSRRPYASTLDKKSLIANKEIIMTNK